MKLADITPMILTQDEEANLESTLSGLKWASQILIVDSFSSDSTQAIATSFPRTTVIERAFDHFADQCNFGLDHISTPWVLSLDADYQCDETFVDELEKLEESAEGYRVAFRYGVFGHPLRASLYPPRIVLYRRDAARYERDGHAHRVVVDGSVEDLRSTILHDDRKSLSVWLDSQKRYAELEADKLMVRPARELNWKDRARKRIVVAPILTAVYCLVARGLLLDGWRGLYYTLQRVYAELLLALTLLDRMLRSKDNPNNVSTGRTKPRTETRKAQ
jgi:glycosyltransferase involved in cell wall biosynthesis